VTASSPNIDGSKPSTMLANPGPASVIVNSAMVHLPCSLGSGGRAGRPGGHGRRGGGRRYASGAAHAPASWSTLKRVSSLRDTRQPSAVRTYSSW
jgi:hypothetical protein